MTPEMIGEGVKSTLAAAVVAAAAATLVNVIGGIGGLGGIEARGRADTRSPTMRPHDALACDTADRSFTDRSSLLV